MGRRCGAWLLLPGTLASFGELLLLAMVLRRLVPRPVVPGIFIYPEQRIIDSHPLHPRQLRRVTKA